jgi:hypothetical protein
VRGIDWVLHKGEVKTPSYFLHGELSSTGWWYYFPVAMGIKTPLGLLLLALSGLALLALRRRDGPQGEFLLWLPLVLLFAAGALFTSLYIGVRHMLPAAPLLCVLGARAARDLRGIGGRTLVAGLTAWHFWAGISISPYHLSYFNELVGGPGHGHEWLVDSNIDWGQDLVRLKRYMDEHGIKRAKLAYFGRADPGIYGIEHEELPEKPVSGGVAVVSATFLQGRPYFWLRGGKLDWVPPGAYSWIKDRPLIGRVGYSLFVFDLGRKPRGPPCVGDRTE